MLPVQCRMARTALNIGVRDLAEMAKVSTNTITRFEALDRLPDGSPVEKSKELKPRTVDAIRSALESAGVIFIDQNGNGPGVRLRERQT